MVSGSVRNARPAIVSQPVSEVSFFSRSRRYCSSSARQPVEAGGRASMQRTMVAHRGSADRCTDDEKCGGAADAAPNRPHTLQVRRVHRKTKIPRYGTDDS